MDPNFKPYKTGMLTIRKRYPCGCGDGHKGRNHVYYLCRCDCGKEVIFSGDEIIRHPYSFEPEWTSGNRAKEEVPLSLKSTEKKVFESIKNNPKATAEEIATQIGMSQSTIKKTTAKLSDLGLISRQGSRRDGYWKI